MPRWEAKKENVNADLLIPIILSFGSLLFVGSSIYFYLTTQNLASLFLVILALSILIYFAGRVYGELTRYRDFIEITTDGISYRSTPPFGSGWLAQSGFFRFEQIYSADLVQVSPFYNANRQLLAILLKTAPKGNLIIGNNLNNEQLVKVGMALKGTVALSNQMQRFLGVENVGESFKGFVDTAKTIWNQFKDAQKRDD